MKGYDLIHQGALALCDVEAAGIHIDVSYCQAQTKELTKEIERVDDLIETSDLGVEWAKHYAHPNYNSGPELRYLLYEVFGFKAEVFTKANLPAVDDEALRALDVDELDLILERRKYLKIRDTYLSSFMREAIDGIIHPFFSLHTVQTYRSSGSSPNFQNIPIRDPFTGSLVRGAILPSPGRQLLEIDYSAAEVRVAACYHKDPVMIKYIEENYDMHLDMAAECYKLPKDQVSKDARYCGKNKFIFPQFYGDYFEQCAKALWKAIGEMGLITKSGVPMRKHLVSVGIRSLKQFTAHIKRVEYDFWKRRFKVYDQWKEDHYNFYLERGFVDMFTGFRCGGIMERNQVINYPVQGAAFHCLLWSLIKLNAHLHNHQMKSRIIAQIHDSIILDVDTSEVEDILPVAKRIMTEDIREEWDWLIVPLEIEAEITPIDGNWAEKKEITI